MVFFSYHKFRKSLQLQEAKSPDDHQGIAPGPQQWRQKAPESRFQAFWFSSIPISDGSKIFVFCFVDPYE